jgi:hypothetical protein
MRVGYLAEGSAYAEVREAQSSSKAGVVERQLKFSDSMQKVLDSGGGGREKERRKEAGRKEGRPEGGRARQR